MATVRSYFFNNSTEQKSDVTDMTQQNLENTRYSKYSVTNYFQPVVSDQQIQFVTQQPALTVNATAGGSSVGGGVIDVESMLRLRTEQERPLEKVQLMSRPYMSVPYLGRGSCDPALESQLQQGEIVSDRKSVNTIMSQSFMGYTLYPTDDKMEERVKNPSYTVEEAALAGWVRGGSASREMYSDSRPSDPHY